MFHRHNNSDCTVVVNESESRCVWYNGEAGDQCVELWLWTSHLWADTKDGTVCDGDAVRDLLIAGGMDEHTASRVVDGNFSDLPTGFRPRPWGLGP